MILIVGDGARYYNSTDTVTGNLDDSTPTTDCIYQSLGIVYPYTTTGFDDEYFDWLFDKREAARKEAVYLNKLFIEHFNRLQIALIFNTYSVLFYRRMMFPKSGFLARAGRRKRN